MTIEMQMVLNQFIERGTSIETMHEVMSALQDVKAWHKVVNAYKERNMHDYARMTEKHLKEAKEECSKILKRAGIEYTVEELITF